MRVLKISLVVLFCAMAGIAEAGQLRAGAARSNITPPLDSELVGNWDNKMAQYAHDELWARCLVLDNGTTRVAFVVCDLLGLTQQISLEARKLIQLETDLPTSHVVISATHTHSAASALGDRYSYDTVLNEYQKFVVRRIVDSVRSAIHNLEPARIGWATANEPRHVFNRRWYLKPGTMPMNPFGSTNDLVKMNPGVRNPNLVEPAGPVDPEICFFAVQTTAGRPLGLFANYSLHYVGGTRSGEISADYYGLFNDRIQQLLDADRQDPPFVSLMSNGTSANINNVDVLNPDGKMDAYAKMRIVANDVAQKVVEAYKEIQWRDNIVLGAVLEEMELQYRRPTPEQLEWAQKVLAKTADGTRQSKMEETYATRAMRLHAMPEQTTFPLQAVRIGELGIATFPTEVFSEIGLEIKAKSVFKPSFVISLAHGYYGYLPTIEQHALGGYETWLGTNLLEIQAAPKMVARLLAMLEKLQ